MRITCAGLLLLSLSFVAVSAELSVPSPDHKTVASALSRAQNGDTVWVADGEYREDVLLNPGVVLKARTLHKAILDGKGRGTVVTLAHGSAISGFVVRNGTIGIVSKAANTTIEMCRIERNAQSGVMCVGHLPAMSDNVIAFNKGSGIQGWDVRSTNAAISHNTVAFNDNHGVALGGVSDIVIENCILAHNGQYGVKMDVGTAKARVANSNVYRNGADIAPLSNGSISVDPLFADSHRFDFTLQVGSGCIRAGSDGSDMGARLSVR
jgi:hypothetical protein